MDVLIFLGIVAGIIYLLSKYESVPNNQEDYTSSPKELDFEIADPKPVAIGKNKWLLPSEDIGKMEEGVADYDDCNKGKRFK